MPAEPPTAGQPDRFPRFNADQVGPGASRPQVYATNDSRRQLFQDKVAIAPNMQYTEEGKRGWLETISNYLISKAFELSMFLPWAESAQSVTIT